jgi:putative membrane protein
MTNTRIWSDKLTKLQGADFDRAYINAMVQGHQEVLGKGRARAQNPGAGETTGRGQSEAQLTQWAAKVMPTLQMHLDRARELQKTVAK